MAWRATGRWGPGRVGLPAAAGASAHLAPPSPPSRTWLLPRPLSAPAKSPPPHPSIPAGLLGCAGGQTGPAPGGGAGRGVVARERAAAQRHRAGDSTSCGRGWRGELLSHGPPSSCPSSGSPSSSQTTTTPKALGAGKRRTRRTSGEGPGRGARPLRGRGVPEEGAAALRGDPGRKARPGAPLSPPRASPCFSRDQGVSAAPPPPASGTWNTRVVGGRGRRRGKTPEAGVPGSGAGGVRRGPRTARAGGREGERRRAPGCAPGEWGARSRREGRGRSPRLSPLTLHPAPRCPSVKTFFETDALR